MSRMAESTLKALSVQKLESLKTTRRKLEEALQRVANGEPNTVPKGTKVSAASVSKEAQIDRATLYRFHEPVLTEIRRINDALPKTRLKESRSELSQTNAKLKEYRYLVEQAQNEVVALARINYGLDARISALEALLLIRDEHIARLQKHINENKLKTNIFNFSGPKEC